jgi:hypothetical protein
MPCDHKGPQDVIADAEALLAASGASPADGMKFRWAENHNGYYASAITEIERRDGQWVVTRLDRSKEPLPESDCGLLRIA